MIQIKNKNKLFSYFVFINSLFTLKQLSLAVVQLWCNCGAAKVLLLRTYCDS